jgi:hypothetical protein
LHSGAYVLKAVANYRNPNARKDEKYATGSILLNAELKPDTNTTNVNNPINAFLPGVDGFNELFTKPYETGAHYQYRLELAPKRVQAHFWYVGRSDQQVEGRLLAHPLRSRERRGLH